MTDLSCIKTIKTRRVSCDHVNVSQMNDLSRLEEEDSDDVKSIFIPLKSSLKMQELSA